MKNLKFLGVFLLTLIGLSAFSQKMIDKSGSIKIFSQTSLFIIEAENNKVASVLNKQTGDVVASTLVKSFKFHEALVEEHFNENYMESATYPKSEFKGKITNFASLDLSKDGTYDVTIEGALTMHGVTNPVKTTGKLVVSGGNISATTEFVVSLQAYKIKVEESYKDRINDEIKLTVKFAYVPLAQ